MLTCPRCKVSLRTSGTPRALRFDCVKCEGAALSVAALRAQVDRDAFAQLLRAAAASTSKRVGCPSCFAKMRAVQVGEQDASFHFDVCSRCQLVWLDRNEEHHLPAPVPRPKAAPSPDLDPVARRELARSLSHGLRDQLGAGPPASSPSRWLALLGFPVVEHTSVVPNVPLATWLVAAWMLLGTLVAAFDPFVVRELGFLPQAPLRYFALTPITSFLLHAGAWHLIGNAYFLLVLGPHVEELLGGLRYLGLLFAGTLAGDLFHALLAPRPDEVVIGASAGISAVVVLYALAFPRARVKLFGWRYGTWIALHANAMLVLWLLLQLWGLTHQLGGAGAISFAAHVGGALTGAVAYGLWRR